LRGDFTGIGGDCPPLKNLPFQDMHGTRYSAMLDPSYHPLPRGIFKITLLSGNTVNMTADAKVDYSIVRDHFLYFGNLIPHEKQYKSGLFYGLALHPKFDRDISH
jgi:hypothetical protein